MIRRGLALLASLLFLLGEPPLSRADEPAAAKADARPLAEQIAELAQPLIDAEAVVGMSIGIIRRGERETFGFGKLSNGDDRRPDGKTVYEIGSATKVFTGILLADMAQAGLVKLDDPAQSLMPEGHAMPQRGDAPITLANLSSHASGLPRMPSNFAPADPTNPYADYDGDKLLEFLKTCKPARAPVERIEYSNLGAGLLGFLLARKEGKSYEQLVLDRIAGPLELTDLRVALDDSMRSRLAPGHDVDGAPAANWDLDALAGAGGLRSTADSMLAFLAANLDAEKSRLVHALELARQPRHPLGPGGGQIALGWHILPDNNTVWHNGQTGGYHSLIAFDPTKKTAVVVLSNTATGLVDPLGFGVLKMLSGDKVEPIAVRKAVDVDAKILAKYAGKYQLAPTFHLDVTVEDGKLFAQATMQPRFRLYAESDAKFFYRVVEATVEFESDEKGNIKGLVLHQGGRKLPGKRVEE